MIKAADDHQIQYNWVLLQVQIWYRMSYVYRYVDAEQGVIPWKLDSTGANDSCRECTCLKEMTLQHMPAKNTSKWVTLW